MATPCHLQCAEPLEAVAVLDLRESTGDGETVTWPLQLTVWSCMELEVTYASAGGTSLGKILIFPMENQCY